MDLAVVDRRVALTRTSASLAAGDVLAIGAFVVAGELSHGYHPIADAGRVLYVLWPFLLGWVLGAVAFGRYAEGVLENLQQAVLWTAPAWALAVAVALAIRSRPWYEGGVAPTFALVALGVGGAFVVGWRALATLWLGAR